MSLIVELVLQPAGSRLEMYCWYASRVPQLPPRLPVDNDNWRAPDAAEVARVIGGVRTPKNHSSAQYLGMDFSQTGNGHTERPQPPWAIDSMWDRELDG
jgi:hypothetical protein